MSLSIPTPGGRLLVVQIGIGGVGDDRGAVVGIVVESTVEVVGGVVVVIGAPTVLVGSPTTWTLPGRPESPVKARGMIRAAVPTVAATAPVRMRRRRRSWTIRDSAARTIRCSS
jgi:hypothetical protein